MSFVQADHLSLAFGDRDLLADVHLTLTSQSRAALCGNNGSGKSTLLKLLAGLQAPDSGQISRSPQGRIAFLPQTGITHTGTSLFKEMQKVYAFAQARADEKKSVEAQLALLSPSAPASQLQPLLETHYRLEEAIRESGFYQQEKTITQVLTGLGFKPEQFDSDCGAFSGGWQMRIALAGVLLQHPDLLLLDEPTNYLDIEAREWLTSFLTERKGGYLLVSHDRCFLDATVTEIYEIFQGRLKRYKGTYTQYEAKRSEESATLLKAFEKQQAETEHNEAFIRRFRSTATKASAVQSRIRQLEKIQRIELPDHLKPLSIRFPEPPHCGERVLSVDRVSKSYGQHLVFSDLSFQVTRGEKIALTGSNGSGKTTLLKAVAGVHLPDSGSVRTGTGVQIGYFAQESSDTLHADFTLEQELEADCPTEMIPKLRNLAGAFLFSDEAFFKPISVLSGGEKNRLTLLKLMLQPHNVLILDEPTNHLDLHSKEVLLEALRHFGGTVLFVSHDRYFVEGLATRILHLEGGRCKDYPGNYQYYRYRRAEEAAQQPAHEAPAAPAASNPVSEGKTAHLAGKEARNRLKIMERKEADLLQAIDAADKTLAALTQQLSDPAVYSDPLQSASVAKQKQEIRFHIEALTSEWEALAERIAALQA